jgi:hypothetical protein
MSFSDPGCVHLARVLVEILENHMTLGRQADAALTKRKRRARAGRQWINRHMKFLYQTRFISLGLIF